jgi:uncharacterized protein (DUF305 family)
MLHQPRAVPLLALAVMFALGACADSPTGPAEALVPDNRPRLNAAAPDRRAARFEIDFMQDMIDHHAMAVEMAEICLGKAVHEELRALCENIIAAQSAEIEQMQSWLRDWYGISYEPRMKQGDERMLERLASLSGAQFEIEFMQMMIQHHERAIREAEDCLRRAYHRQLRRLCENIIETQSAEIEQLQTWLCEWYDICEESGSRQHEGRHDGGRRHEHG